MAHWQLDEQDKARAWFAKAVQWMEKGNKEDAELKRMTVRQDEVLRVLGSQPSSIMNQIDQCLKSALAIA
jgi:hypothetical protein